MFKKIFLFVLFLIAISNSAIAGNYWHDLGSDWSISFDNGQAYIDSVNLPRGAGSDSHSCIYNRAQLTKTYGDDSYRKNMFAYVLAGSVTKRSLKIVLDSDQSTCEFFGAMFY